MENKIAKIVKDLMKKNEKGLFEKRVDAKGVVLDLANRGMVEDFWTDLEPLKPLMDVIGNTEWHDPDELNELLTFIASTLKIDENRLRRFYYNVPEPEFEEENPPFLALIGMSLSTWKKLSKEDRQDIIKLIKERDIESAKRLAKRLIGLEEAEPETVEYYEEETEETE